MWLMMSHCHMRRLSFSLAIAINNYFCDSCLYKHHIDAVLLAGWGKSKGF